MAKQMDLKLKLLFLQVEEFLLFQPSFWPPRHGPHDLHDGHGQSAPGTWRLHA